MGANDATVIVGTLSDEQLVSQINNLVNTVKEKTGEMKGAFDDFVLHAQKEMQKLGSFKIDSGTASDSGSTKAVNAQKELGQEIERTTKKAKEQNLTFDQSADVMEKITRSGLRMNFNDKELDSMKQKLRELEAEYTKINREGGGSETQKRSSELRAQIQALNEEIKQYEASLKGLRSVEKINVPFDVKEWVENIDRVDNRLKQLNKSLRMEEVAGNKSLRTTFAEALKMPTNNIDEIAAKLLKLQWVMQEVQRTDILSPQQLANGNAQISVLLNKLEAEMSLKQQIKAVDTESEQAIQKRIELEAKYGDEVRNAAQIANEWMQKNKRESLGTKEGDFVLQAQESGQIMGMSLENQLLRYKERNEQLNLSLAIEKAIADEESRITAEKEKQATSGNTRKSFGDYEDLRQAIASVLHIRTQEVSLADKQNASYNALSSTLKQLQQAYLSLSGSQRDSLNAELLIKRIHETQRAMQEIQKQMSRPESIDSAMALPEKTLDEITYKIQMLRSYVQGVNIETENGEAEVKRILNYVDSLNEKTKNIQKTSKQINADTISRDLGKFNLMPESSYQEVANKYKQLKKYVDDIKNSKFVDEKSIERAEALLDRLARKGKKLQENLGTNKNVQDAMGMSANTLDEIARKMQRLQAIRSNLNINTQKTQIDSVNGSLAELSKLQDSILKKNSQMVASNTALGRSWNYMKNRLAFYFTVGASTQFVKNLIEVRSQYEMNERALGILIDSAERGTQIFKELSQMALVSPYTLIELSSAAKQLTAYDIAAKDVVDTTRRLADMTAAVGIPVERLTYALGQIKAYGYLNSRDARMFANAGIPLVKQLADYYTQLEGRMVSTADVYDRMKKKAIDYNEVMDVVYKMTDEGGKFFDFQAKMAETLKVQIANLTLAWNNMLNDIGESQQGMLSGGIQSLKQLFLHWKEINKALTDVVVSFGIVYGVVQMLNFALGKGVYSQVRLAAATEETTVAEYKSIISKNNLNAAQLRALIAINKNNGALIQAAASTGLLSAKELTAAANASALKAEMYFLQASALKVDGAMKGLAATMSSNMLAIASFAAVAVAIDLLQTLDDRKQKVGEFGDAITKNAKENAEAIKDLIDSLSFSDASTLPIEEQTKAWERLREQIELSAAAANIYIAALMREPNMAKRVNSAKELLQELESIHETMQYWHKDDIQIGQDFKVLGLGVDGMATDLDDYIESYHKYIKRLGEGEEIKFAGEQIDGISMAWARAARSAKGYIDFWSHGANIPIISSLADIASSLNPATWAAKGLFGGSALGFNFSGLLSSSASDAALDLKELKDEAKDFVESLKAQLDTDEVTDPLKIREALQQTLIDAGYTGDKLKTMTILSEQMLRGMYDNVYASADEQAKKHWDTVFGYGQSSMEEFMLFVRSRNSRLLSNIAEEDINNGKWLTEERKKKLDEYLEKFKSVNYLAYQDLKTVVNDMNKLSVFIPVIFGVKTAAKDLQEDFKKRLGVTEQSSLYQDVAKNAETMSDIVTTLQNNQEKKAKEIANVEAAGGEYAEKHLAKLKQENDELVNAIHSYNAKTKAEEKAEKDRNKGKSGKKDELLEALKQEISLVSKLQSEYDKLTSKGLSHADALDVVQSAYEKTINFLNNKLKNAGLPQLDLSILTGKDPNKQLQHFQDTLNTLVSKGLLNLERSKELEAVIEKLTIDAKTYNLDKITKGLNNELSKLKEDYELAVELDAEPELGNMFANMLGIDVSSLPKSFSDALDMAQSAINNKLKEMKISTPFDVMRTDVKDFAKISGLKMDSGVVKELENAQKTWRDIFKKNLTETEKYLDDYVKKYGDYSDKIAEVEANRLEKLKKLNEAYFTEEMRKLPEYAAKLNAIEQGSKNEKQQVKFDEFKESRYYTMMFENLDYISTKTIRDMRDRLRDLMDSMDSLTPEQLKAIIKQYETIEKKLVKRSPFKTLGKDVKEYLDTMSDRKKANEAFRIAQQEYDKQKEIVAELKEKYEVVKRIELINPIMVAALQMQINSESELLQILKEKLELAEKTADKYNLIKKTVGEELAQTAQMISANLSSLDDLRDNLQETFGIHFSDALNDAIDGMAQLGDGISNVISSAQSGNIIGVISGIASAIGGIGTAFGLGAEDYFTPMKESVEKLISVMQKIADYQLKALQEMSGGRAVAEYRKLIKNNDEVIKSYRELAKAAGESGASGGSHSYAVRTNRRLADSWRQISAIVGTTVTKVDDLYKLSPEKLKKLMTEMPTIWQKITPEIREALEGIIEYGDKAVEYTEKLGEALTNITLDQLTDDFESMLRDMDNDAEKFAENFEEYMRNAIVRSMMTEMFSGRLEAWYENFKKSMEDNVLTKEEVNALREEYMGIVNDALSMRDQLFSVVGSGTGDKSLSALQQGIQGITEDTAGALEAYMNSVSQQVYLHSELLTQIRDAVAAINSDVTLGIQSQILLELQNSYQVQSMISTMLAGWSNPSGQAVRVEMV